MEEDENLPCSSRDTIHLDTTVPPDSGSCLIKNMAKMWKILQMLHVLTGH